LGGQFHGAGDLWNHFRNGWRYFRVFAVNDAQNFLDGLGVKGSGSRILALCNALTPWWQFPGPGGQRSTITDCYSAGC
jgi:hypothetical protein